MLGYLFAVLALASERQGAIPLLVWTLLCGVFVFDATVTLLRRAGRRERLQDAHRDHAYQRVLKMGWGHASVSATVLIVNVALALIAYACVLQPDLLPLSLAAGIALLAAVYGRVERVVPRPIIYARLNGCSRGSRGPSWT